MPLPGEIYNVSDIIGKTLYTKQAVNVYSTVPPYNGSKPMSDFLLGTIPAGKPAGVVYSYLNADPANRRASLWWMFEPASNYSRTYFIEHQAGIFDVKALREQGVISTLEKIEEEKKKEEDANAPWYTKLAGQALPWIAAIVLGGIAIKAILSRPTKSIGNE